MNDAVRERLQTEEDLRASLAGDGFRLHFQPQFDVGTREIVAWEALLRWPHPTRGLVPPEEFIPIAEETGLILPLGEWALRTACRELKRWEQRGLGCFRIGVNLSARQFTDAGLVAMVASALQDAGLEGPRLELEITEGILMGPGTLETLKRLKALGVILTLDDFGTGYSSLSYLKTFAVDRLKIDRSFVADIDRGNNAAIVRAVISMAQALDLGVVAEGVETRLQKDFLVRHGCREVQGFLRGGPMPAEDIPAFLGRTADREAANQ
jgi:EAL domain-containing protein (putative c-di-GMP-specific phosphodiesterase class I)